MMTIELSQTDYIKHADSVRRLAAGIEHETGETIRVEAGDFTCVHAADDEIGGRVLLGRVQAITVYGDAVEAPRG